jgi:hypothetical protein
VLGKLRAALHIGFSAQLSKIPCEHPGAAIAPACENEVVRTSIKTCPVVVVLPVNRDLMCRVLTATAPHRHWEFDIVHGLDSRTGSEHVFLGTVRHRFARQIRCWVDNILRAAGTLGGASARICLGAKRGSAVFKACGDSIPMGICNASSIFSHSG